MLELENVHVRYGPIEALHGVSLRVAAGTIVTLIGGNGAGKSTTLRAISGLLTPTAGRIIFEGRPIQGRPPHEVLGLGIGHVPEGRQIFPDLTVWENPGSAPSGSAATAGCWTAWRRCSSSFPCCASARSSSAER